MCPSSSKALLADWCCMLLPPLCDAAALPPSPTTFTRGSACVTVLGVYYVAPLSTVATVLRNRDSSTLYWPLSMMNVINGCLWFAYGLAIFDWFICVPNGVGAAFNIICLGLCFVFPAKNRPPKADANGGGFFRRFSSSFKKGGSTTMPHSKDTDAAEDVEATGATNITANSATTN